MIFLFLKSSDINIYIIIIIILLIFLIYLSIKYIRIVKKNIISDNLKCILNKTIKEKELLLKELHHRVKNNLQIIVSLLNIQARISKNPQIDFFIDRCTVRIKSMLLIHEMLCISEDVSKVNFKEYIENLIHNIHKTYEVKHINYNVEMEPVFFDIEIAIPLGLIVNELINNSYKYAFPKKKQVH